MISIVIPCYNQIETLPDTIESVLSQTKKPDAIIIVDDGSTDGSGQVADSYAQKNKKIKVIHQVNKGLASARNCGIMNCRSKYILFLDSDDMLLENCLEKILETIKYTNADIIAPSFRCFGINQDDVILGEPKLEEFKTANRLGYFCAIKRDILLEVGGYNPKMIWGYEDYDLWFDLLKRGKTIAIIKEPLVLYRTKEKSMITVAQEHHEELMSIIRNNHKELFV